MEAREKKKAMVLAVLAGFLVVYWGYYLFFRHEEAPARSSSRAGAAGSQPAKPSAKDKEGGASITVPIKVDLGLLKFRGEPYRAGRNIFNPVYRKPVLAKPGKGGGPITVQPLPPPPPPPPPRSPEEIAADNAREEINKVKVLGFLKRKSRTDVFLSLGNDNFIVAKGDTIKGGYYLKEVGKDFVIVADRGTNTEVKLSTSFEAGKGASNTVPSPGTGGGPPGAPPGLPAPPMGGQGPGPRHMNPSPGPQPGQGTGVPVAPYATPYTPSTATTTTGSGSTTSTSGTTSTTTITGGGTSDTEPAPLAGHSLF